MAIGAGVKILFAYLLIGIPQIGARGAPISTFLCDVTVTVFNLKFLSGCVPRSERVAGMGKTYGKPMLASVTAIAASLVAYSSAGRITDGEDLPFLCAVAVAVMVYGALVLLLGIVTEEDLAALPLIGRLVCRGKKNKCVKTEEQ